MYIENLIREYELWKGGDSIFINAPTGSGKTSFVLNVLTEKAKSDGKEVLFLCNRILLKDQIRVLVAKNQELPLDDFPLKQISEFDGITVISYQYLQELIKNNRNGCYKFSAERYQYVVFDEAHYMLEDSLFNANVIFLEDFIRNCFITKIFMSATLIDVQEYLVDKKLLGDPIYSRSQQINSYLKTIPLNSYMGVITDVWSHIWVYTIPETPRNFHTYYYSNFEELLHIINGSQTKWLIFISNIEQAKFFKKMINVPCEMIHANDKPENTVDTIIREEKFDSQVLLTTSVLDNGINIKDREVKNVVIDTVSRTEFLQMLGRKRLTFEEDAINLYIPQKSCHYFSAYLNLNVRKLVSVIKNEETDDLLAKILADPEIYQVARRFYAAKEGQLVLNPFGKYKLEVLADFIQRMINRMSSDSWAFVREQLAWLGLEDTFTEQNSLSFQMQKQNLYALQEILEGYVDRWIDKEAQIELRLILDQWATILNYKFSKSGRLPGLHVLQKFLEYFQLPYTLTVKKGQKKGDKSLWRVVKT